jgi:hypothetical protein
MNLDYSALAKHSLENHVIDFANVRVLDRESRQKREVLEMLHIGENISHEIQEKT